MRTQGSATFFHPDYTVGTGLAPVPALRLVDFAYGVTTDWELGRAPLTLPRRSMTLSHVAAMMSAFRATVPAWLERRELGGEVAQGGGLKGEAVASDLVTSRQDAPAGLGDLR